MNEQSDIVALVNLTPERAVALFSEPKEFNALYGKIEEIATAHVSDTSTKKGRDETRRLAAKITKTKTTLDRLGKDLKAEWQQKVNAVDAARRDMKTRLDTLRDRTRKPLTDFENAEKARQEQLLAHFHRVEDLTKISFDATVEQVNANAAELAEIEKFDGWAEHEEKAAALLAAARTTLQNARAAIVERDRQAEENARLKLEAEAAEQARAAEQQRIYEERCQRETQEHIEREAREKAEHEQQARINALEREKADAERQAAQAVQRAIEAKERAEREAEEARLAAEQAERDRFEGEKQAERDRIQREAEKKAARELAAKQETERVAQEEAAAKKRKAEASKRAEESVADLMLHIATPTPMHKDDCTILYRAIAAGEVRHVGLVE